MRTVKLVDNVVSKMSIKPYRPNLVIWNYMHYYFTGGKPHGTHTRVVYSYALVDKFHHCIMLISFPNFASRKLKDHAGEWIWWHLGLFTKPCSYSTILSIDLLLYISGMARLSPFIVSGSILPPYASAFEPFIWMKAFIATFTTPAASSTSECSIHYTVAAQAWNLGLK